MIGSKRLGEHGLAHRGNPRKKPWVSMLEGSDLDDLGIPFLETSIYI